MNLARTYHAKLINIKKEMHSLHEKTVQLKVSIYLSCQPTTWGFSAKRRIAIFALGWCHDLHPGTICLTNLPTFNHQIFHGHPRGHSLQPHWIWRHQLLQIGNYRSSKTSSNATSQGFGLNYSGAAFCLAQAIGGLLVKLMMLNIVG